MSVFRNNQKAYTKLKLKEWHLNHY
ncbi:hypothetical protein VTL71DRAFT_10182 [Oculimacula yallundae]|uniref:Uncharacterized protein n=1 Tax=Oculimacula yallundae TaxID=86028 RepID=A0ABR4BT01_9HELO